jgi:hypothetical protein
MSFSGRNNGRSTRISAFDRGRCDIDSVKALGLTVPSGLLARADEVIE